MLPMTPAARLQAAIEIVDEVIASAREDGAPADAIVTRYFKTRRYAGSKDRRAVRELVFRAIRRSAEVPQSGREAAIGMAEDDPGLLELFGQPRGPEPVQAGEKAAIAMVVPEWLAAEFSAIVAPQEQPALLERAPLDLRVNAAKASRDAVLGQFPIGVPTPLSPWGIRLPADSRIDDHPAFGAGIVEVQDEGSQLIALACDPKGCERRPRSVRRSGWQVACARGRGTQFEDPRDRQQPSPAVKACAALRAGRHQDRNAAVEPAQRARRARGLAREGGHRSGRCAMLRKRHLAAQPGRPLAPHARTA